MADKTNKTNKTGQSDRHNQNNQNNQNIAVIGSDIRFARMIELELANKGYVCKNFYIPDSASTSASVSASIASGGANSNSNTRRLCADALNYYFENDCNFVIIAADLPGGGHTEFVKLSKKSSKSAVNIIFTSFDNIINDFKKKITGKEYAKNNIVFIKRPFNTEKFLKEVAAFQKKTNKLKTSRPKIIQIDGLTVNEASKTVTFGEAEIDLTKKEYDLLVFLMKNRGEPINRQRIFVEVWGFDYYGSTNVVDVFVRYLRNKIDQKYKIKLIHTVRGVGYMIRK